MIYSDVYEVVVKKTTEDGKELKALVLVHESQKEDGELIGRMVVSAIEDIETALRVGPNE